ncbi:hypothetical protein [Amycolatopsis sp. NPDC054798]
MAANGGFDRFKINFDGFPYLSPRLRRGSLALAVPVPEVHKASSDMQGSPASGVPDGDLDASHRGQQQLEPLHDCVFRASGMPPSARSFT